MVVVLVQMQYICHRWENCTVTDPHTSLSRSTKLLLVIEKIRNEDEHLIEAGFSI